MTPREVEVGPPAPEVRAALPIEGGWLEGDAAFVFDSELLYRFDLDGRRAGALARKDFSVEHSGQELRLVGEEVVKTYSLAFEERVACGSGEGFHRVVHAPPFEIVAKKDENVLVDTRSCKRTPLHALAFPDGEPILSPSGKRIGIPRGFCEAVDVYDTTTMKKVSTDARGRQFATAKGCDPTALGEDGVVSWTGRGYCAIGTPSVFVHGDRAIVDGNDAFLLKRGVEKTGCPGMGTDESATAIARLEYSRLPASPRVVSATAKAALVLGSQRAVLVRIESDAFGAMTELPIPY